MITQLHLGDCIEVCRDKVEDNSIDTIIQDPPAGIAFMGRKWDSLGEYKPKNQRAIDLWTTSLEGLVRLKMLQGWEAGFLLFTVDWAIEALRVIKPGGMALVWSIPRTGDLTQMGMRMAGWEIRDKIAHLYGSGFPKSASISRLMDKAAGAKGEVIGTKPQSGAKFKLTQELIDNGGFNDPDRTEYDIVAPATNLAQLWDGWGTALKPAREDWILAMAPREGTFAQNAEKYGVAGLNIDGARVPTNGETWGGNRENKHPNYSGEVYGAFAEQYAKASHPQGRWPANLILDEHAGALLDVQSGERPSCNSPSNARPESKYRPGQGNYQPQGRIYPGDAGGASRFFYCAKASRSERNLGLDSTRTVKYNRPKYIGGLLWQDVSMALVELLRRVTSESTGQWLIGECGESIMGLCPEDSLSTTLTEISRITESRIFDLLTRQLTSESIAGANCEMACGGNHVTDVENSSPLIKNTGISPKKDGLSTDVVKNVISELLSKIKDEENWTVSKNRHATVKPIALMRYLVKLTRTPTGGTVLDMFMGSGSTGMACVLEDRDFIGIEKDPESFAIAEARIGYVQEHGLEKPKKPTKQEKAREELGLEQLELDISG